MDAIWLPVFRQSDDLQAAKVAMDESKHSGVIVVDADRYDLVCIGSVMDAIGRGATKLSEASDRDPVHLAGVADAAHNGVDLIRPLKTRTEYEALLRRVNRTYVLVAHAYTSGLLVTMRESDAASLSSTYYCNGSKTHYFPKPSVKVGEDCPKCLGFPKGKIFLKP
jgi:hypothetical protein